MQPDCVYQKQINDHYALEIYNIITRKIFKAQKEKDIERYTLCTTMTQNNDLSVLPAIHKLDSDPTIPQLLLSELPNDIFHYYMKEKCRCCLEPKLKRLECIITDIYINLHQNLNLAIIQSLNKLTIRIDNTIIFEIVDDLPEETKIAT